MKFAFLFPGQGSQSIGMMQGFAGVKAVHETFAEASAILGQDLWHMVTNANEDINQTINTQPIMLTSGIAIWRAWQQAGGQEAAVLAGHSLGEYSALVAAGSLDFAAALPLVRYRAEVMQSAVAEGVGAMAAVLGLDDDIVSRVCTEAAQGEVLEAVNFNSPGQVVIAGHKTAVQRGMEAAKVKGAKRVLMLPVSVPSHCILMKPAAQRLKAYLDGIPVRTPRLPVLHNADVAAYNDVEKIKDALVRQLYSPVRWVETVRKIAAEGIIAVAECGPGKVLAGLNKRIANEMTCFALDSAAAMEEAKAKLNA